MSAIVCGKRSFFEDIDSAASSQTSASQPVYKKFRCSSPVRFTYSPPVPLGPVDHLKALFPDTEIQNSGLAAEENPDIEKGAAPVDGGAAPLEKPQLQSNLPVDGAAWVDLLVKEMINATSLDDAKSRAARVLENLEKSISTQARAEVAEGFEKENMILGEQIEALLHDNAILKRAVAIQHERQKEHDERKQEVEQLKQLLAQYQEQLRTLEVNNYALSMHFREALQSNSIPGHFHRDAF